MFDKLRKRTSQHAPTTASSHALTAGTHTMPPALQRAFSRGVNYNMKLLILGDTCVGKTSLFQRLRGANFSPAYRPSTQRIESASIAWNYRLCDHVIKVDVWDVTEQVTRPPSPAVSERPLADIYRDVSCILLVYDVTKRWTFEHASRWLQSDVLCRQPPSVCLLLVANHVDAPVAGQEEGGEGPRRQVTRYEALQALQCARALAPRHLHYVEASMRCGRGLRYIHSYLNVPFLELQAMCLRAQLQTNRRELVISLQELRLASGEEEEEQAAEDLEAATELARCPLCGSRRAACTLTAQCDVTPAAAGAGVMVTAAAPYSTEQREDRSASALRPCGAVSALSDAAELCSMSPELIDPVTEVATAAPSTAGSDNDQEDIEWNPMVSRYVEDVDEVEEREQMALAAHRVGRLHVNAAMETTVAPPTRDVSDTVGDCARSAVPEVIHSRPGADSPPTDCIEGATHVNRDSTRRWGRSEMSAADESVWQTFCVGADDGVCDHRSRDSYEVLQ